MAKTKALPVLDVMDWQIIYLLIANTHKHRKLAGKVNKYRIRAIEEWQGKAAEEAGR